MKFHRHLMRKAKEKNSELGMDFYSEDPEDYVYIGLMESPTHKLLLFYCKKSKSTIAIDPSEQNTYS